MESKLEQVLLNTYKEEMITFLATHPEYFDEAIELAIGDKERLSWRAAWLLWSCIEENDPRMQKHIDKIIKVIPQKKDGHQRELIKIVSIMELDEKQEGTLFNICMYLWEQINKTPSVRWTAFKFILKMAEKYHDLSEEISFLTQDHYLETLSPGIRDSVSKSLSNFNILDANK